MKSDAPNNLISGLKIVPGHILRGVIWALQAILNPKIGSFLWPSTQLVNCLFPKEADRGFEDPIGEASLLHLWC